MYSIFLFHELMMENSTISDCDPSAKPFCCPVCGWATKYQHNLIRHIKRNHYDYYHYNIYMKKLRKDKAKVTKSDFIRQHPSEPIEEEEDQTVIETDPEESPPPTTNYESNNSGKQLLFRNRPRPAPYSKNNYKNYKRSKPTTTTTTTITPPTIDPLPVLPDENTEFAPEISTQEKKKEGIIIKAGETDASYDNAIQTPIDIRLIPSFKVMIVGPSRSGKTTLVQDLLLNLNNFSSEPPKKIIFIYAIWQPVYDKMKADGLVDVFVQDNSELESQLTNYMTGEEVLFIFDDMINSKNINYISDLFMIQGRHKNVSLVFISQQGFRNDDAFRSISNNTNYMILMKNDRNILEIQNLAKQITPGPQPLMMQIYRKATADAYSYLFINFTNECRRETKYLSHLFDEDDVVPTYVAT